MKRLSFLLCACLLSVAALGATPGKDYGMAGCGLGSQIFGTDGQIFAATTNGTVWNQLFGITSGTSQCVPEGGSAQLLEQKRFLYGNLNTLEREISQGDGETLRAYADVLGCSRDAYPEFANHLRQSYGDLFASPGAESVLEATKSSLKENHQLAQACGDLG